VLRAISRITLAGAPAVTVAYTAMAVVMTWPLVTNLGDRLAGDLGDPAFNAWVLAWTSGQVLRALSGDPGALAAYWHGNIFHPEPLTLAYSEHLTAQMLQGLPIYAATGNVIAVYNVLFLSTFVLSGLGMYLFVRDLTGRPLAAFLAGVAFAFAPYRLGQFSHLQVLSSQWMPFALYGFRRYFASRRPRALAGGTAALVMQNLSCGYFLLFFSPFAAAYCLYEIAARQRWLDWRMWGQLAVAAGAVALVTWLLVQPYLQLREIADLGVRNAGEIEMFSADTYAFATPAPNAQLFAGRQLGHWAAEGEGFVGFTIAGFAAIAVVWALVRAMRDPPWGAMRDVHVLATALTFLLAIASAVVVIVVFVNGGVQTSFGGQRVIYRNAATPLTYAAAGFAAYVVLRALGVRYRPVERRDALGFLVIAAATAALLALGPTMQALGRGVGTGPYAWLLAYVPGFDGLRVPARYLMLVAMFLAALAGIGASVMLRMGIAGRALVLAGAVAICAESWFAPMTFNAPIGVGEGLREPPPPGSGRDLPPIYRRVSELPAASVLLEFPFGSPAYEVMATFYAGHHRLPIVNGYSGFFPGSHTDRVHALRDPLEDRERAAAVLAASGATHVLVHQQAFAETRGQEIVDWLIAIGARPVAQDGPDRLFALR
jgi:hypothetical protein